MTQGYHPVVAIGEAMRKAAVWALTIMTVKTILTLLFDFVIDDRGCPVWSGSED